MVFRVNFVKRVVLATERTRLLVPINVAGVVPTKHVAGFPRSGKSQGKMKQFQGQGKVREF